MGRCVRAGAAALTALSVFLRLVLLIHRADSIPASVRLSLVSNSKTNAVVVLLSDRIEKCMGVLLRKKPFILTTARCAKKLTDAYALEGAAPTVAYSSCHPRERVGIKCTKPFKDKCASQAATDVNCIALIQVTSEEDAGKQNNAFLDLPSSSTARNANCSIIFASQDMEKVPVQVTVTSLNDTRNGEITVKVKGGAELPLNLDAAEGAALACGGSAVWGLLSVGEQTGGLLSFVNVHHYLSWVEKNTAIEAGDSADDWGGSCGGSGVPVSSTASSTAPAETTVGPNSEATIGHSISVMAWLVASLYLFI